MAMINQSSQLTESTRLQNEKIQAEIDKLKAEKSKIEAEQKEILSPFWRRMQWYASVATIVLALTAALYGYFGKYFEAAGHEQEAKQKNLEYDTKVLQDKKDTLVVKFLRDSIKLENLQTEQLILKDTIRADRLVAQEIKKHIDQLKNELVTKEKYTDHIKDSLANSISFWKKHAEGVEDRVALTRDYYMDSCSYFVHNYKVIEKLYNDLKQKCKDSGQ